MRIKGVFLLLFLLVLACAGVQKKSKLRDNSKTDVKIHNQYWHTQRDNVNLYSAIDIPLTQLVFQKENDHFFSDINFTVVISKDEDNIQVFRQSWSEKIIESYYEDTRNRDNIFRTDLNISLPPGDYKYFLNIQDKDSRENLQQTLDISLQEIEFLGTALPFTKDNNAEYNLLEPTQEKIDTLFLRCQVNLADTTDRELFYKISSMDSAIDSGNVSIHFASPFNVYYIPIPFGYEEQDHYTVELLYHSDKQKTEFEFGKQNRKYWTTDIKEVVGVMRYIFPTYSEYKELKDLDKKDQWKKIDAYWKSKDPTPDTPDNPLLEELNNRARFVNKNFSVLMQGWRSDRGRIYIIYGEPHFIDEGYQNDMGYQFQKWVYPNGKEFIFIDRTMSGDYTLYKERF
ncbi:MAG: GWxTD domain-containing protein [Candidatus Marinimicrobia bacterium]|nr:GWxTD domain-containing protein [Candidatus Neomarinimicrobiota bacterium]MDP6853124.1 GWxTD domain-containing protein [Candidatus Neomarinimicrobiota bacterium]MDP6936488.1 GWxTD domain-containing protein [Candidatus Neomarinimicrobiota bacterium]